MSNGVGRGDRAAAPEQVRFALYVQPPVSGDRTTTIDRLTDLKTAGALDEYEIVVVGGEVILSEGGRTIEEDRAEELGTLAAWTSEVAHSSIDVEELSTRMGRSVRKLSMPSMLLAVYHREDLVAVFPCTDGTHTWTVRDALDSYESTGEFPSETGAEFTSN
jgi:hypothetical protein